MCMYPHLVPYNLYTVLWYLGTCEGLRLVNPNKTLTAASSYTSFTMPITLVGSGQFKVRLDELNPVQCRTVQCSAVQCNAMQCIHT